MNDRMHILITSALMLTLMLLLTITVAKDTTPHTAALPSETPQSQEQAEIAHPTEIPITVEGAPPLLDERPDDTEWTDGADTNYHGFTPLAQLGSAIDSVGLLSIEKIGVMAHVYDSADEMADMQKGISHYRTTSYWDGNIGFAAHIGNTGHSFFARLHELEYGDIITYETEFGTRCYVVTDIATIADTDWSRLARTEDNRVTLTTCVDGQPEKRLCVQAEEIV